MMGVLRWIAASALILGVAACSTTQPTTGPVRFPENVRTPAAPLGCVPYARDRSGITLRGDAWTWWDQAAGRYARTSMPELGALLVLTGYGREPRGHLAVVRKQLSPRLIHVDHANWLNDGRIYLDNPVADVSPANDWSQVRVYNLRDGGWGLKTYAVQGFITARPDTGTSQLAQNRKNNHSDQ